VLHGDGARFDPLTILASPLHYFVDALDSLIDADKSEKTRTTEVPFPPTGRRRILVSESSRSSGRDGQAVDG